ncbi:MAG: DUF1737 domain-containing protein [Acidimicrobiia bacterium]|nr:DUF1737 domain-containing protein [Acidimicrobiia bacterium]
MTDSPETPPLTYRLLTGQPDREFCERVSEALDNGYVLYGQPLFAAEDGNLIAAQAVVRGDGGTQ